MNWIVGLPDQLLALGETTFRYRGTVDFQISRNGMIWFCHYGFQTPPTLSDRKFNRDWGRPVDDSGLCSTQHEAGWGSFTKAACLRKVCRSIERELRRNDAEDRAYLEAKMTNARLA